MPETQPVTVYGSSISYFTGKLENYLRNKGIAYEFKPMTARGSRRQAKQETGSDQYPSLQLADGRWMTDTTPIIQWFERETPEPAIIPSDPVQRFFSLLLEDYADEWLWRPAMHYRWHYTVGARFASSHLAQEIAADAPFPAAVARRLITRRQRQGYTAGDGITADQVKGVEDIYLRTLDQLEAIFSDRPFLLGERPTLADIGFSGPFFRHFALDPVPAEIARTRAPAVYEWTARLWRADPQQHSRPIVEGVPEDWGPILMEVGTSYLPYLCANVDAVAQGRKQFDVEVGGVSYRGARWSPYRVWCLAQLQAEFKALTPTQQETARAMLARYQCWEPLWRHTELPIAPDFCSGLPFRADAKMIDVYD